MSNERNLKFVILFSLFAFSNLFACSGVALLIGYNRICTLASIIFAFFYYIYTKRLTTYGFPLIQALVGIGAIYILGSIVIDWSSSVQLTNYMSLFGILFWVEVTSLIKWSSRTLYQVGIATAILGNILIYLLLPGHIWSGWNSNSAVYIIPVIFFAIASLYCSGETGRFFWIGLCACATTYLVLQLENRSSLVATGGFILILMLKKVYQSKTVFRIFYLFIIGFNLGFPYLNSVIMENKIIQNIGILLESLIEKNANINGRDELWKMAIERISENPCLGSLGVRTTYFHNFSMDVLTQFGWIGWMLFIVMLIMALENSFIEHKKFYKYNILLVGFLMLVFLSTFENALVANNYFTVFIYVFIGAATSIKNDVLEGE